jgi:hypothetical protein
MREIRLSGSEGGGPESNRVSLPLSNRGGVNPSLAQIDPHRPLSVRVVEVSGAMRSRGQDSNFAGCP